MIIFSLLNQFDQFYGTKQLLAANVHISYHESIT